MPIHRLADRFAPTAPRRHARGAAAAALCGLSLLLPSAAHADGAKSVPLHASARADSTGKMLPARRVRPQPSTTTTATLTPATTGGQLSGPSRGQYLWFPDTNPSVAPSGGPSPDRYLRLPWNALEPRPGQYDFSLIEQELSQAQAAGGTVGFRVMAVCGGCKADSLPSDISALPTSWTATGTDADVRVPDWNDPRVISRWESLMRALGARFDGNPHLGYVDVGGYGNWGEQHNYPYSLTYPRPTGQREGTKESIAAYASAVIRSFPKTYVSYNPPEVMANGKINQQDSWSVLKQALLASPKVGIRNDCLGGGTVQGSAVSILTAAQDQAVAENLQYSDQPLGRWTKAPFITEWCGNIAPGSRDGSFEKGLQQVRAWHVSGISNGNFKGSASSYSPTEQAALRQASMEAGYRLSVKSATLTRPRGSNVRADITWLNSGVAPTYRPWSVTYSLSDQSGTVVATVTSALDLRALLGSGSSAVDHVTLPGTQSLAGTFRLSVRATDPTDTYSPLPLEAGTRTSSGAYELGTITLTR